MKIAERTQQFLNDFPVSVIQWFAGCVSGYTGANLAGANLEGADLKASTFIGTNLTGANLDGADLRGAQLQGALFTNATFKGANLSRAQLMDVEGLTSEQIVALLNEQSDLSDSIDKVPAEGSLLPDTYSYALGDTRQSLITRMESAMADST